MTPTYTDLVKALTQLSFMARTYSACPQLIRACEGAEQIVKAASEPKLEGTLWLPIEEEA